MALHICFFMAEYLCDLTPRSAYVDRKACLKSLMTEEEYKNVRQPLLNTSRTVYVGNLSFYTSEGQIASHFAPCGRIESIVMGLGYRSRAPCGFCFVVFESTESAMAAVQDLDKTLLDDSTITVSWDTGLDADETRRWGRAPDGQVIDEKRPNIDDRRGGIGGMRREAHGLTATVLEDDVVVYDWVLPQLRGKAAAAVAERRDKKKRPRT